MSNPSDHAASDLSPASRRTSPRDKKHQKMTNYYAGVGREEPSIAENAVRREKGISAKAINPPFLSSAFSAMLLVLTPKRKVTSKNEG